MKKGVHPSLYLYECGGDGKNFNSIANPRLILFGAAADSGIIKTFLSSLLLGFHILESSSNGIIVSADGHALSVLNRACCVFIRGLGIFAQPRS